MVIEQRTRWSERDIMLAKEKANTIEEVIEVLKTMPKRTKAPPPPEGSISVREASRKYGIPMNTISWWARKGKIETIARTKNWLYLNEESLKNYINARRANSDN